LKLAYRRTLVAIFALHSGVRPQQREAVLVILYLLDGNIPALNRVTLGAVRAHFSLVDVGVAILAILANIGEDRFDVALRALHLFVHAAQRILCLVVIELRDSADGAPTRGAVAVLARNRKRPMRASRCLTLRGVRLRNSRQPNKN
jgi:hypothetical protein